MIIVLKVDLEIVKAAKELIKTKIIVDHGVYLMVIIYGQRTNIKII